MPDALESAAEAQLRVMKHLPGGDLSLIVLKGHLLVEELLYVIVKSVARHPAAIDEANLNFYRLAQIAKAFSYEERLKPVWDAIFALNRLRNMFAHDLEAKDLDKNLRTFAQAAAPGTPGAGEMAASNPEYQIKSSVEFICGALASIAFQQGGRRKQGPSTQP